MNVEAKISRTKAEEALAAEYRAMRGKLAGGKAASSRRDNAFGLFEQFGLPHRRIESWKYTDLRALLRSVPPLAGEASWTAFSKGENDPLEGFDRARIVVINGVFARSQSDLKGIDGIEVASLADVLVTAPERIEQLAVDSSDAILALNTAFMQGGVVVRVAPDAKPKRPIEIVHLTAVDEPAAVYVHDVIEVGANASVRFIDSWRGPAALAYQVNGVTELDVGRGAKVSFSRLQAEGAEAIHLGSFAARVGDDASLDHLIVSSGAQLSRWQGLVSIAGKGARIGFYGANMLAGKEHGDIALVIEHAEGYSQSRELFKNVVDGEAQGAFQGRIVVKPGAQKTDAKMMTQALLLSDRGEFASKPELEIFADDVQCGHGATAGQIDANQLFYLMARGIPRAEAERLLIEAFLDDAIDAIGDEDIANALKGTVSAWLTRRGGAF